MFIKNEENYLRNKALHTYISLSALRITTKSQSELLMYQQTNISMTIRHSRPSITTYNPILVLAGPRKVE